MAYCSAKGFEVKDWVSAEDSFLQIFSENYNLDLFYVYSWTDAPWSKFNFIRSVDNESEINFKYLKSIILSYQKKGIKIYFKTHEELSFNKDNSDILFTKVGVPISHCSNLSIDFLSKQDLMCDLIEVKSAKRLQDWWIVNSDGRKRENPFESVIYKKLEALKLEGKHKFYLLKYDNQFVTSLALTETKCGYNCWGLATIESYQRMGLAKKMYDLLGRTFKNPVVLYSQNNFNSDFYQFRKSKASFIEYTREYCYETK